MMLLRYPLVQLFKDSIADTSYHRGYIRFNTDTEQFEGFGAGESWAPLGGLTDIDKDTFITAETTPNADNDQLKFYTDGVERLNIDTDGALQIPTNGALSIGNSLVVTAEPNNMVSVGSKMIVENELQLTKGVMLNTDGLQLNVSNIQKVLDYALQKLKMFLL